jgi:hypothetical protein
VMFVFEQGFELLTQVVVVGGGKEPYMIVLNLRFLFYIPFKQQVGVRPVWGLCSDMKGAASRKDINEADGWGIVVVLVIYG